MRRLWERIMRTAHDFGEPMSGIPLAEIAGDRRVLIENHRGVICYNPREIQVKVSFGYLSIYGEFLEMKRLAKDQLVIQGSIHSVCINRGE